MRNSIISILVILFTNPLLAANTRSADAVTTDLQGTILRATVKEGFHFNEKAPNAVVIDGKTMKPTELKARTGEFRDLPVPFRTGIASLYVCDDAQTFCEKNDFDLKGGTGTKTKVSDTKTKGEPKGKINRFGFIENDLQKAIEQAKKKNQLVLLDFSARWCPGCVRYETETFGKTPFQVLTKDYVKVRIDTDLFENAFLSEKYQINEIPTLLVINTDQEEVDRLRDYQADDVVKGFFEAIKTDPTPIAKQLANVANLDSSARLRLGKRLFAAERLPEAIEVLSKVNPPPAELVKAKIRVLEKTAETDEKAKLELTKTLHEAINKEPESLRSLDWRLKLVQNLSDAKEIKAVRDAGVLLADRFLQSPPKLASSINESMGEFGGYEPILVAMTRADLIESAKSDASEIKAGWKKAAETVRGLNIPVKATGPSMRVLSIFNLAEEFRDADQLATALRKKDPNNGELARRHLPSLLGLSKFTEAIKTGKMCIENSYGRNEFWVAESLAKAYIGDKKPKDAKDLLDKYLQRSELEWPQMATTKKKLEDLRATVM